MSLSHLTEHLQVLLRTGNEDIFLLWYPLIAVETNHIYTVITGIAVEQALCRQVVLTTG